MKKVSELYFLFPNRQVIHYTIVETVQKHKKTSNIFDLIWPSIISSWQHWQILRLRWVHEQTTRALLKQYTYSTHTKIIVRPHGDPSCLRYIGVWIQYSISLVKNIFLTSTYPKIGSASDNHIGSDDIKTV